MSKFQVSGSYAIEIEQLLCQHRKIPKNVQIILRQEKPIRLEEKTRLRRIGQCPCDLCAEQHKSFGECLWQVDGNCRNQQAAIFALDIRKSEQYRKSMENFREMQKSKCKTLPLMKKLRRSCKKTKSLKAQESFAWIMKPVVRLIGSSKDIAGATHGVLKELKLQALLSSLKDEVHDYSKISLLQQLNVGEKIQNDHHTTGNSSKPNIKCCRNQNIKGQKPTAMKSLKAKVKSQNKNCVQFMLKSLIDATNMMQHETRENKNLKNVNRERKEKASALEVLKGKYGDNPVTDLGNSTKKIVKTNLQIESKAIFKQAYKAKCNHRAPRDKSAQKSFQEVESICRHKKHRNSLGTAHDQKQSNSHKNRFLDLSSRFQKNHQK